ncbi:unnamed protein product [Blepharisma stoltei]|uniref:Uncharacterized protein n=1 Tax=Blepharisma stoltei TaxID=1481888 RepID=A0AAU9JH69_9CILI|nr:unnamed protein product [Blepharisma stoltei]
MKRNRKKISQKLFTPLTSPHPLGSSARISTKGYSESYREICSKIHIMPNNHITSDLRNCEMKLNVDELKDKDLKSIQASLPGFQLLKRIFIWGRNFTDLVLEHDFYSSGSMIPSASEPFLKVKSPRKFYLVPNPEDKSDSEIHIDPGTVCNSRNRSYNAKVLKSLSLNMANNRAMTDIKLIGLKIGKEGWNFLAEGLEGEIPLVNLYINFCKMEDENLSVLIPPLMKSKTIKNLDFSSNELEESSGYDIGRIINMQIERRDHDMWLAGLRGSYIENPNKEGLEELNLSNNKLKDRAIYDLCHAFYHDNVLRCLDLKKNKITLDGIKEIVSLLYSNSSLLFLDIRENVNNEGTGILKAIITKLRKNFAEYSHENEENKAWKSKLMKLQQAIDPIFISEPNSFKHEKQPKKVKLRRKDTFDSDEYKNDELANKYLMKSHSEEISKNSSESDSESEEYIRPRQSLGNEHYLLQGQRSHDKCLQCHEYEEALENAENVCRALSIENTNLKKQIETLRKNDRNQQSWSNSAISRVEGQVAYIAQPESISAINASKQAQGGTGDDRGALQRIEAMMSELTRLMDVLEMSNRAGNAQSSVL